ncbi:MAG: hypothetical protein ABSG74_14140 [Candidatus Bathyarchaeia archaeon]
MIVNTCSGAISLAKLLESNSAKFYEDLSRSYAENGDVFISFAKENASYISQAQRAYHEAITDAIEGCFTFSLDPESYAFETELPRKVDYSEALERAIEIEDKIVRFYLDAAMQSKSLMADVPRVFRLIAKKRSGRQMVLRSLLARTQST